MSSRHQPLNGADSAPYIDTLDIGCRDCGATYTASESHTCDRAQPLADAIALVEAQGFAVMRVNCIACAEPSLLGDLYCRQHRLRIRDEDML